MIDCLVTSHSDWVNFETGVGVNRVAMSMLRAAAIVEVKNVLSIEPAHSDRLLFAHTLYKQAGSYGAHNRWEYSTTGYVGRNEHIALEA